MNGDHFFPKLRVRIKDNNSSPHGKFHRFLFPFSSKFPDLNFASYVLYIYLRGTHSEPGVTCGISIIDECVNYIMQFKYITAPPICGPYLRRLNILRAPRSIDRIPEWEYTE